MRILMPYLIMLGLPFFISEIQDATEEKMTFFQYCNARYEFCIDYPSYFFTKKIVGDNGDGVTIYSEDELFDLTVAGDQNLFNNNSQELYQMLVEKPMKADPDSRLLYVSIQSDYYETAFIKGAECFYQKMYCSDDKNVLLELKAPKEKYNELEKLKAEITFTLK